MRTLALALAAAVLAGCSSDDAGGARPAQRSTPPGGDPVLAANTPADLRHPCRAVSASVAGDVLGEPVTARRVVDPAAGRSLRCTYRPTGPDGPALVEIRSAPDLTSLARLVGFYIGTDRLQHHPAQVAGSDGAEVVLQPGDGLVTVFAKQGFVTHVVVVRAEEPTRAERAALRLADLVVRAND